MNGVSQRQVLKTIKICPLHQQNNIVYMVKLSKTLWYDFFFLFCFCGRAIIRRKVFLKKKHTKNLWHICIHVLTIVNNTDRITGKCLWKQLTNNLPFSFPSLWDKMEWGEQLNLHQRTDQERMHLLSNLYLYQIHPLEQSMTQEDKGQYKNMSYWKLYP